MKEDFLHYVWKFQKINGKNLKTYQGDSIKIISPGQHNQNAGPDFFNAQISIEDQLWAGNVEIHLKSSDWYAHHHEKDKAYDTVILHVVYEHDLEVIREDNSVIPVIELKDRIAPDLLNKYGRLFSNMQRWIPCENDICTIESIIIDNWLERLFVERLEKKSELISSQLANLNNHWEALLFRLLCKNFGRVPTVKYSAKYCQL